MSIFLKIQHRETSDLKERERNKDKGRGKANGVGTRKALSCTHGLRFKIHLFNQNLFTVHYTRLQTLGHE